MIIKIINNNNNKKNIMKSRSCTELPQEVQLHVASRSQLPGGTTWGTVLAKDPAEGAQLLDGHGMSRGIPNSWMIFTVKSWKIRQNGRFNPPIPPMDVITSIYLHLTFYGTISFQTYVKCLDEGRQVQLYCDSSINST